LNTEFYIASRIIKSKMGANVVDKRQRLDKIDNITHKQILTTGPIVKIASASVAIGIAVMIIAIAVVTGFKAEIRDKVIGFGSHIQITNFDSNSSYEPSPIEIDQPFYPSLKSDKGIKHIQVFATKAGIIKTKNEIQGIVLKGIGKDYNWEFFNSKIIEGNSFKVLDSIKSNKILISKYLKNILKIKLGDNILIHFIQDPPRIRKFTIEGIYETGLEEFDKRYIIADIGHIQKLNDWTKDQVGGFEILIDNYEDIDKIGNHIYYNTIGADLSSQTIKESHSQLFDWLELQDMNTFIILTLMTLVAGINMISALLVLMLEKTNTIGILKAMGARDWSIRKIFIYIATSLIGKGMFVGNIIGIGLCLLQKYSGIIELDQASYYVSVVPIHLEITDLLLLNLATLTICVIMLIFPSIIISKINPIDSIRFN